MENRHFKDIDKLVEFFVQNRKCMIRFDSYTEKYSIVFSLVEEVLFNYFFTLKVLLISSRYAVQNIWFNEYKKHSDRLNIECSLVLGHSRQKINALLKSADIYLATYEAVMSKLVMYHGKFDLIIIDDIDEFRNSKTQKFQAMSDFCLKLKNVIGIIVGNEEDDLNDLWSEYYLLDAGYRLEKHFWQYCEKYFFKIKKVHGKGYHYEPKKGASEEIKRAVADITYQYSCAKEVEEEKRKPPLQYGYHYAYMNSSERTKYMLLSRESSSLKKLNGMNMPNLIKWITKLIQAANGFFTSSQQEITFFHSRKWDALNAILHRYANQNVLIAYWFEEDKVFLQKRLGNIPVIQCEYDLNKWNEGKYQRALIHPAVGNERWKFSQGGNILIWYSLTWSVSMYQRMNSRMLERDTDKKNIEHILTKQTIDELIYSILQKKNVSQEEFWLIMKNTMEKYAVNEVDEYGAYY